MTALDRRYDTQIHRRTTRTVMVGDVAIGSNHPVVVQSMINEDTLDIDAAVAGIVRLAEAGSEIVRVTTPSMAHARAMGEIRAAVRARGCSVPLVADVHHNGVKIAMEVTQHVDKVRINPGLFVFDKPDPNREEFSAEEFAAIGARIRVITGELVQTRWVQPASGYASQNPRVQHFGLGEAVVVDRLEIRWPSGQTQAMTDLEADQRIVVFEGL